MNEDRYIFKYTADANGNITVPFSDAKPVLVARQFADDIFPTLWCDIDVQSGSGGGTVEFCIVGTGHPIPEGAVSVGSAVCGAFVWHVLRLP